MSGQQRKRQPQTSRGSGLAARSEGGGRSSSGRGGGGGGGGSGSGSSRPKVSQYVHPRVQQRQQGRGRGRTGRGGSGRAGAGAGTSRGVSAGGSKHHNHHRGGHHHHQPRNRAPAALGPAVPLESYPGDLFFGTSSLVAQLDKPVIVMLQDKAHVVGILRSFDQFGNFVLEKACRRFYEGEFFTDVPMGLYIIRGENVEILGEIDLVKQEGGVEGGLRRMTKKEFEKLKLKKS